VDVTDAVGRVATLAVGAMFVVAGGYKIADGPAWPRQAADLGVSRRLAVVVPWFEIVLGVALLIGLFPPWPAVVAGVTLVVFTVVIGRRLLDGSRPPCACFGSRSARPLGSRHVVRNLGLLAVAVVAMTWS
jgi:hypothetical protein